MLGTLSPFGSPSPFGSSSAVVVPAAVPGVDPGACLPSGPDGTPGAPAADSLLDPLGLWPMSVPAPAPDPAAVVAGIDPGACGPA